MALLFTILLGLTTGGLGWMVYSFNRANMVQETEAAIDTEIAGLDEWYEAGGIPALRHILTQREARDPRSFDLMLDAKGRPDGGNLPSLPRQVSALTEGLIEFQWPVSNALPLTVAAKIRTYPDGEQLLVGRDIGPLIAAHGRIVWLTVLMAILMGAVVVGSFLISFYVVARINEIASFAEGVVSTDQLSDRIALTARWDDLSHLAHILNRLFGRIERLVASFRHVSENVAHDLRTPLTRLKNRLEEFHRTASPEQQPKIDKLIDEADGLLATFASLLQIARLESGAPLALRPVEIGPLLRDLYELYEPLAEARGLALRLEVSAGSVPGDRDLLFQLLSNLFDNAIKFSPTGGSVRVGTTFREGSMRIAIADDGPGLAPQDRDKVFERFYRADTSRNLPGNGLGLSLVAAIASAHGARVELINLSPGLRAELVFPAA